MKRKLSISMDERTIDEIQNIITDGLFRNKSHFIEYAVNDYLKKEEK